MAKDSLFPLKMLVISLGLLLVGGFIFLLTVVMDKATGGVASVPSRYTCTDSAVTLPAGAEVTNVIPSGSQLWFEVRQQDKRLLMMVDSCTGRVQRTLTLTTVSVPAE